MRRFECWDFTKHTVHAAALRMSPNQVQEQNPKRFQHVQRVWVYLWLWMLLGNIRDDESETFETRQLRHSYRLEVGMLHVAWIILNSLDPLGLISLYFLPPTLRLSSHSWNFLHRCAKRCWFNVVRSTNGNSRKQCMLDMHWRPLESGNMRQWNDDFLHVTVNDPKWSRQKQRDETNGT